MCAYAAHRPKVSRDDISKIDVGLFLVSFSLLVVRIYVTALIDLFVGSPCHRDEHGVRGGEPLCGLPLARLLPAPRPGAAPAGYHQLQQSLAHTQRPKKKTEG